jgi:hypothetical protein
MLSKSSIILLSVISKALLLVPPVPLPTMNIVLLSLAILYLPVTV